MTVRRRCGRDDRASLENTLELLGVNTTEDHATTGRVDALQIDTESSALDEVILLERIDDKFVGALKALQSRTSTHDTSLEELTLTGNTEDLLGDSGSANANIVVDVVDIGVSSAVSEVCCSVQVLTGGRLLETGILAARYRIGGTATVWVDPEFGATSVEDDLNLVSGCTQGQFNEVEQSFLLALNTSAVLASGESLGMDTLDRELENTRQLDSTIVVKGCKVLSNINSLCHSGQGERQKSETHDEVNYRLLCV